MKTSLECIPCFVRQALDAAKVVSPDPAVQEQILREVLHWVGEMNMEDPAPIMGQRIHRRLRELTGINDPYRAAKENQNRMANSLLPELRAIIETSKDRMIAAVQLAIAGNVIDMGGNGDISEPFVRSSIQQALEQPILGNVKTFRHASKTAKHILYLADNAGEIVFDRLLIEQLVPDRVTLAVRGAAILNDATRSDAHAAGLDTIVEVIDNGSDIAGTVLSSCSQDFRRRFARADLIIAKGQGNFETLSDEPFPIFFLFKAKCAVIAAQAGVPLGAHVLARAQAGIYDPGVRR